MRGAVRELLRVSRVDPVRTINPKVTQYTVTGKTVDSPSVTRQLHTINVEALRRCHRRTIRSISCVCAMRALRPSVITKKRF